MPWPHRNLTTLGSAAGPAPQAHPNSQSVPFPDGEREADPLSFVAAPGSPSPGHEARLVVAALRRSRPLMLHLAALAIRLATRTRAQSSANNGETTDVGLTRILGGERKRTRTPPRSRNAVSSFCRRRSSWK